LITFTAIFPFFGGSNGMLHVEYSFAHSASSMSALAVVIGVEKPADDVFGSTGADLAGRGICDQPSALLFLIRNIRLAERHE